MKINMGFVSQNNDNVWEVFQSSFTNYIADTFIEGALSYTFQVMPSSGVPADFQYFKQTHLCECVADDVPLDYLNNPTLLAIAEELNNPSWPFIWNRSTSLQRPFDFCCIGCLYWTGRAFMPL